MLLPRSWVHYAVLLPSLLAAACGGGNGGSRQAPEQSEIPNESPAPTELTLHAVTASAGPGGNILPLSASVAHGSSHTLTVTPETGFAIAGVTPTGCTGTLSGTTYTTEPITADCRLTASFAANLYTVTAIAGPGGSVTPASASVSHGQTTTLTMTPNDGFGISGAVPTGCTGTLTGNTFTTDAMTANCEVVVSFIANTTSTTYTVTATAGSGGSISPASVNVNSGESTVLTVTPDSGYGIANVTASGCSGTLAGATYTTAPITAHCAVAATFVPNSYTVTATSNAGGGVAPGRVSVSHGASTSLTLTPEANYTLAHVTGCNGSLSGMTYTTGPITSNCTVTATFAAITFTVTGNAGAGGSITPGSVTVIQGASTTLTITPDTGYTLGTVTPTDCTGTLAGNTFTTGPIATNCTVAATFVPNVYTLTADASSGGSITPASVNVTHGETTTLTVTPDTGFGIASITATGCSGTLAGNVYTTAPLTADCTLSANFAPVSTTTLAASIAAGGSHTCALTNANTVQCWGNNFFGELGNGTTTRSNIPVNVSGLTGTIASIVAGAQHSCALTTTGTVQCWGYNTYGQLGNRSNTSASTPVAVIGLSGTVTALVAGSYHTCALLVAGTVQCWGYNAAGQLGNGSIQNVNVAGAVSGLNGTALAIAAGSNHTCARLDSGAAFCWGGNSTGQLGNGTMINSSTPVAVLGLNGRATQLITGANHTCALTSTGATQCWGNNVHGQLGNGTTTNSTAPVTVAGLSASATTLGAGNTHTCAFTVAGTVECWGGNNNGQLGNGTTANSTVPGVITGLGATVTALSSGYGHNCVLISTGAAQCWGYNLYGQLGNGGNTNSLTPVTVTGLGPAM